LTAIDAPVRSHRPRTLLPHFLALICALALAYASLQPFAPWIAPTPGSPFFLFAPWPPRWTRFDVAANVLAYFPFGFFVALMPRRRPAGARLSVAVAAGAALAFALETLQMFVPPRDANLIDLFANTAGAGLGGLAALPFVGDSRARRALATWRERTFVHGALGDVGLALITVWLVAQVNPALDLAGTPHRRAYTLLLFGLLNWTEVWFRSTGPIGPGEMADMIFDLFLNGLKAVGPARGLRRGRA
jgi:VanZ family protein